MLPKELGRQTALTLMKEMKFLQPIPETEKNYELMEIPDKGDLTFQIIEKQSALHTQHDRDFAAHIAGLRYCVADGEVAKKQLFDIDHAYAHSSIKGKQKALLEYLNSASNKEFAEGFLSAQDGEGANVENIQKYFARDDEDGRIKGTWYFYKLCFNDIDNLLLLCHACNMSKSSKESLEWFGKQEPFLGKAFVEAVKEAGGLHEGVIVQKVMMVEAGTPSIKIGEVKCVLHQGEGQGLGSFVREWFDTEHPGHRADMMDSFKNIWMKYQAVVEEELKNAKSIASDAEQGPGRISPKIREMLQQVVSAVNLHYGFKSTNLGSVNSSLSDDSADEKLRIADVDKGVEFMLTRMHQIKRICNRALRDYKDYLGDGVDKTFIYDQIEAAGLYGLEPARQPIALESMRIAIERDKTLLSSKEKVEATIKTAVEPHKVSNIERALAAERQENEQLKAALAAFLATSQAGPIAQMSRRQENQGLFVPEGQNAQAEPTLADEEENEVVKPDSNSSSTYVRMITQLSGPVSPQHGDDLDLSTGSTSPSERKRHVDMDEETAEALPPTKKEKIGELPDTDQTHLSSIEKAPSSDDGSTQEQVTIPQTRAVYK